MLELAEWNRTFGIGALGNHGTKNCISSTEKFWNQVKLVGNYEFCTRDAI